MPSDGRDRGAGRAGGAQPSDDPERPYLLDVNVLIALAWPHHVHHALAHRWFAAQGRRAWATCPLTQLAFIRISSNPVIMADAVTPSRARSLLGQIVGLPGHRFCGETLPPIETSTLGALGVVGHRQVTDAYLLAVALHHEAKLATLDQGVATLIGDPNTRADLVEVIA